MIRALSIIGAISFIEIAIQTTFTEWTPDRWFIVIIVLGYAISCIKDALKTGEEDETKTEEK